MAATKAEIQAVFPELARDDFSITSYEDARYNCIAFACGDSHRWWWPVKRHGNYWPNEVPLEESVSAFQTLFEAVGYRKCRSARLQVSFERIALFAKGGVPTHAAKQMRDGSWCSKLGIHEDITHALRGLEHSEYGSVVFVMRRATPAQKVGPFIRWFERLIG